MDHKMTDHSLAQNAIQVVPAASLVGAQVFGLTLPDWAALFGIAFVVVQGAYLLWKWRREARKAP